MGSLSLDTLYIWYYNDPTRKVKLHSQLSFQEKYGFWQIKCGVRQQQQQPASSPALGFMDEKSHGSWHGRGVQIIGG